MKNHRITIAGALAVATFATFATFALAAPINGNGAVPPHPVDDEAYPASCNSAAQVKKVMCPATITYNETTSAIANGGPGWTSTTLTKPASFANATVGGTASKTVMCVYTSDNVDRMSITQLEAKACVMAKKFRGANCCL